MNTSRNAGEKNGMWGKKHTPEALEKMRLAHLGLKRPPRSVARLENLELYPGNGRHMLEAPHIGRDLKGRFASLGRTWEERP